VEKVHRSFLEVGVDVLETDTFRSNRITMAEYKLQDRVIEINETAARLARRLADEYAEKTGQPRFVAGSIGPSGKLPSANDPDLSNVSFDDLAETFREQAVGLIGGGVDVLLIETSQDILEVKAAITGIHKSFDETQVYCRSRRRPCLIQPPILLGTDVNAAPPSSKTGIDLSHSCSTGPENA
jgi:5-methyltetrahydrofolate--homocysteine methyltransferase